MSTICIPNELKFIDIPRALRPRCGALTRAGTPCRAQALKTGFCYLHSGVRTIAVSPEGKERQRANGRRVMQQLWSGKWANGGRVPGVLSDEGKARIIEAQKRRSPESRYPSEETRLKISAGRRRFETTKRAAVAGEGSTNSGMIGHSVGRTKGSAFVWPEA